MEFERTLPADLVKVKKSPLILRKLANLRSCPTRAQEKVLLRVPPVLGDCDQDWKMIEYQTLSCRGRCQKEHEGW